MPTISIRAPSFDGIFSEGGGGSGVFFAPNIGAMNNGNSFVSSGIWNDVNRAGSGDANVVSNVTRPGGQSKCIEVTYQADEDQALLKPPPFTSTPSLYIRKYEMFSENCEGNWPVGWKTSRYFTSNNWTQTDDAYMSEKFIWMRYPHEGGVSTDPYVWGINNALGVDHISQYTSGQLFGNGLPYIRAGVWYCFETYIVLNSGVDVEDGIMQCRIDGVTVHDETDVPFRATATDMQNGTGWRTMWFGGNISSADFGFPTGETLIRWIDSPYLSTTADWVSF